MRRILTKVGLFPIVGGKLQKMLFLMLVISNNPGYNPSYMCKGH